MISRLGIRFVRQFSQSVSQCSGPSSSSSTSAQINANVPGLSSRVIRPTTEPVGPGASSSGEYKVPEYFSYHRMSYHEAEIEMAKYRCPQPSALKK